MGVKVSAITWEVFETQTALAEVSQVVVEVLYANAYSTPGAVTGAAVSQKAAEVVMSVTEPVKVSQLVLEVVFQDTAVTDAGSASYPLYIE